MMASDGDKVLQEKATKVYAFDLDIVKGKYVLYVAYLKEILGAAGIREKLVKGQLEPEVAILNADMVPSVSCLVASATRAVVKFERQKLFTKTLHSELVFQMSASRKINEAFKIFGIGSDTKNLLVARIAEGGIRRDSDKKEIIELVDDVLGGTLCHVDDLKLQSSWEQIVKYYNITEKEREMYGLEDSVITRIAVGEIK